MQIIRSEEPEGKPLLPRAFLDQPRVGNQAQFWQDLPFIPLGQYFIDSAWRRDISGIQKGMALPINVKRG